jgi:hypothetical protein
MPVADARRDADVTSPAAEKVAKIRALLQQPADDHEVLQAIARIVASEARTRDIYQKPWG